MIPSGRGPVSQPVIRDIHTPMQGAGGAFAKPCILHYNFGIAIIRAGATVPRRDQAEPPSQS